MLKALTGGRLLDPARGIDITGTIIVNPKTGLIEDLTTGNLPAEADIININDKLVTPGFIDLGCRPGSISQSSLASLGHAAISGGYTSLTILPDTVPPLTDELRLGGLLALAAGHCPTNLCPVGALSRNLDGTELADIGALVQAGAYALSDGQQWINNAQLLWLALKYAAPFDRPLFIYPEELTLAAGGFMREGVIATRLGLPAIPAVAEEIAVARDLLLAQSADGRLHFSHLSTARAVSLVRQSQQQGVRASAAAPLPNLLLTSEAVADYDTNYKLKPPLGETKDQEALLAGLKDETLIAIASNHTPVAPEKKDTEFAQATWGGSFLRHAFPLLYTNLVLTGKLDLATLVTRLTDGPARVLGLEGVGSLKPGSRADIAVIDLNLSHKIHAHDLPSNEQNTPFLDADLKGWPIMTMLKGNIVYAK